MESDPTRMGHVFVNLLGDLKLELSFFINGRFEYTCT